MVMVMPMPMNIAVRRSRTGGDVMGFRTDALAALGGVGGQKPAWGGRFCESLESLRPWQSPVE